MGVTDWLFGTQTDPVKGHEVEFFETGRAGEQVFGGYQCVECGEQHETKQRVLWSSGCDGPPREDAWLTAPVGLYVTGNNAFQQLWGKLISAETQIHIGILYPRKHDDPALHNKLLSFDEGDYLYARLRGVDDMNYYRIEEFVDRDVVETIPNEELIVEIDTQAE